MLLGYQIGRPNVIAKQKPSHDLRNRNQPESCERGAITRAKRNEANPYGTALFAGVLPQGGGSVRPNRKCLAFWKDPHPGWALQASAGKFFSEVMLMVVVVEPLGAVTVNAESLWFVRPIPSPQKVNLSPTPRDPTRIPRPKGCGEGALSGPPLCLLWGRILCDVRPGCGSLWVRRTVA